MYGLTVERITELVQGKLRCGQGCVEPVGAAIDTRVLKPGELFFALKGEKTDGHCFLEQARENGAAGAVVSFIPEGFREEGFPLIQVSDVQKALWQTAAAMRRLFAGPVVAITGSTGKTTTKDMLWSILQERGPVLRSSGNYNNELGLPLTLLAVKQEHHAVVLEMGMRGLGEIDFLARLSEPSHGIITCIGHTHQELLGSQEGIAQAKAELISHIPASGGLALNMDDRKHLKQWLSNIRCRVTWVGLDRTADLRAVDIKQIAGPRGEPGMSFIIKTRDGEECAVNLPVPGRHNVVNALLAAAAARQLDCAWEQVAGGLGKVRLTAMRLELKEVPEGGVLLINDAYNANPDSMQAALEVLHSMTKGRRAIAVLGNMYELGGFAEEGHRLVGKKAQEVKVAYLITVGEMARLIAEGALEAGLAPDQIRSCQDNQEALFYLKKLLKPGDVVLIKGSRGVRMEEIAAGILSV
ncbi:MAG: UDP-N-acetylmuramoyl-tripeptide--D-alanyl-D-alanine ligase [Peptococcaceae bacterium]|jgi:UDP-N-acetylmuramoyl-tripeptide--D-alanyl-D-alanine ligase|nr:UDP-N-acetylmuramoyl-tripeptide--D-alanyl-D-alanine ligase [Peptococcaceae bacterium]MDH7524360.1 UDP-N-acetylmuramoyl-tripeptide--D-alanyl-D-alanine ligase [Peptococcaceae bacterium]